MDGANSRWVWYAMRYNTMLDQSGLAELSRQLAIDNDHSMSHNEASMHGYLFRVQESQPWKPTEQRVFLKCRMPRYRAQATTGAPVDPIPDVYYERAIVNNGERVLPYHRPLPLIVAINFEARALGQTSIPANIVVFSAPPACRPFAPHRRAY